MPETLALFDELGSPRDFLVQERFYVEGQEYIAISKRDELAVDPIFLRVEIDNSGNEIYLQPLNEEIKTVLSVYNDNNAKLNLLN
ncbi:MAG: hypothetical protein SOZ40_00015 [Ezakiella sp.]|nr:hypothetical protein [Ezakiella sp.]MDD7761737.1 hypothetical protein [Bacillota bacterium]MDY3946368.1 hypothetical protein [Ezakiella sp.]